MSRSKNARLWKRLDAAAQQELEELKAELEAAADERQAAAKESFQARLNRVLRDVVEGLEAAAEQKRRGRVDEAVGGSEGDRPG